VRLRVILVGLLVSLVVGCREPIPENAQLTIDPEKIDFESRYIGTEPQMSLSLHNDGLADLVISGVDKTGDGAFTMTGPVETTVKGLDVTFIRFLFRPTAARAYSGSITIRSNAQNSPTLTVELAGVGVAP
jgi:hypothetical protein